MKFNHFKSIANALNPIYWAYLCATPLAQRLSAMFVAVILFSPHRVAIAQQVQGVGGVGDHFTGQGTGVANAIDQWAYVIGGAFVVLGFITLVNKRKNQQDGQGLSWAMIAAGSLLLVWQVLPGIFSFSFFGTSEGADPTFIETNNN